MNGIETYYGGIESTADALRVFELCRQGRLGRVRRRLHDAERRQIRSGSVFVFDEAESGIRRWTDGRVWSPSRILGNFLVYRELERKGASPEGVDVDWMSDLDGFPGSEGVDPSVFANGLPEQATEEPGLSESLLEKKNRMLQKDSDRIHRGPTGRYVFKREGLAKKTISAKVDGHWQHLICYYNRRDFTLLSTGSESAKRQMFDSALMAELRSVRVPIDLVVQQNFRRPPLLTASAGPGLKEIPLTAAPRPRRHSALASMSPYSSQEAMKHSVPITQQPQSSTPIPIVTGPSDLVVESVDEAFENYRHPNLLDIIPPPPLLTKSEHSPTISCIINDDDDLPGKENVQPRWFRHQDFSVQPINLLERSNSDEDLIYPQTGDNWSDCFLRPGDPSLPHHPSPDPFPAD